MMLKFLIITFLGVANALIASDYFKVCHKNDPKLEECLKETVDKLRPLLIKGSKDLRIPSVEPMRIPRVQVQQGSGPVAIDSTFTDLKVHGISKYNVTRISADYDNGRMDLHIDIPYLYVQGDYEISGRILVLPITGKGDSWSNYTQVEGVMSLRMDEYEKGKETYVKLKKLTFEMNVKKATIHMNNLFNGNKELGDAMNRLISEHWEVVFKELKPVVDTAISAILTSITENVFERFPKSQILPD